jgi:hypothetical protein
MHAASADRNSAVLRSRQTKPLALLALDLIEHSGNGPDTAAVPTSRCLAAVVMPADGHPTPPVQRAQ